MLNFLKTIYKRFGFVFRITASLALLGYVISKLNLNFLKEVFRESNLWILIVSFILINFSIFISAIKWREILKNTGTIVDLKYLLSLYYKGGFLNNFFPSNIGGDGYKFITLSKKLEAKDKAFISVLSDRLIGFVVLLCFCFISSILFYREFPQVITSFFLSYKNILGLALLGVVLLSLVFFVFKEKIVYIKKHLVELKKTVKWNIIWLSILFNFVTIFNNYLISRAYGLDINFFHYLVFMPLILLLLFLPISFNGVGIREVSFVFFFGLLGVSPEQAFLLSFTPYLLSLITSFIGGVLFLKRKNY